MPDLGSNFAERVRPAHGALAAAFLGLVLSLVGFFTVAAWEDRATARAFSGVAQDYVRTLQSGIDTYTDRLIALRALFSAEEYADGVTRGEFEIFARELMQDLPGLLSMSWAPRVPDRERAAHEAAAQRDGIAGYRISTIDANGNKVVPAPQRPDYYPVYFSTLPHDAEAYGVDLQDGGVREEPLAYARDNDTVAATANFRLQSGMGISNGFYVVLPVYRRGPPNLTFEERRQNIIGFVRSTLQLPRAADAALGSLTAPVNLFVFEDGAKPTDLPIYVRKSGATSNERIARDYVLREPLTWVGAVSAANRHWNVLVVPSDASNLLRHDRAFIVFGAGLLITLLAAGYVWTTTNYMRMLEAANISVSEQALSDPLTGLANRRCFVERLTDAFELARRNGDVFAVHFLDLDGFKDVNDRHGHQMGDALLQEVAARLLARMRSADVVARFGGDEFAVLQTLVGSPAAAKVAAEKLVKAVAAPYRIDGAEFKVSASLGIAIYAPATDGPVSLMRQADLALYSAKGAGRNCVKIFGRDYDDALPAGATNEPRSTAA